MKEEIIIYDVQKKIQKNVSAFGIEGAFLFFLFGWLIFCFMLIILLKDTIGVIFATIIALFSFLIVTAIANWLSQHFGIRQLLLKLSTFRQPSEILCTSMNFSISKSLYNEATVQY